MTIEDQIGATMTVAEVGRTTEAEVGTMIAAEVERTTEAETDTMIEVEVETTIVVAEIAIGIVSEKMLIGEPGKRQDGVTTPARRMKRHQIGSVTLLVAVLLRPKLHLKRVDVDSEGHHRLELG